VKSLNVYTRLENPALSGGSLRVPLRDLVGEHSRPCVPHEIWFPSHEGDWVELADGVRGRVVHQGPEFVQLVLLGGARQTYPTTAFLGLNPRNLSTNFRIKVAFGVDYQHQAIVTREIPERMRTAVERDLVAALGKDPLIHLGVEFAEAGASSLDVHVLADFDGAVAARHDTLRRAIQRSLVDACNANGWVIPFMQVTIHQATPPGYPGA
jgi:small-conductance mechanosensitive channel